MGTNQDITADTAMTAMNADVSVTAGHGQAVLRVKGDEVTVIYDNMELTFTRGECDPDVRLLILDTARFDCPDMTPENGSGPIVRILMNDEPILSVRSFLGWLG